MPKPTNFHKIDQFEFNDTDSQYRLEVCATHSDNVWVFPNGFGNYALYIKIDWQNSQFPSWTLKRVLLGDGMNFSLVKGAEYFGIQHYKTQTNFIDFVKRICEVYKHSFN